MALAEEQGRGENELSRVAPLLACWVMKVASPTREPKGSRFRGSLGIYGLFGKVDSSV